MADSPMYGLGCSSYAGSLSDNSVTVVIFANMMPAADQENTFATRLSAPLMAAIQ